MPSGASTGNVTVTTPAGVSNSLPFMVLINAERSFDLRAVSNMLRGIDKGWVARIIDVINIGTTVFDLAAIVVDALDFPSGESVIEIGIAETYKRKLIRSVESFFEKGKVVGCSFIAGTPVLAESGEKPIEQLKPGDKVLARNEKTGKQSYHQVQQTFATPNDELYNLTLTGSSGKPETLGVTGNHPFWKKDKGWTESDLLKVGDLVQGKDSGWLTVESLSLRVERATGYNLEVEGEHSYFVGDSGAWVHNGCGNLDWSIVSRDGENRYAHVEKHGIQNIQKPYHGIFYGEPIEVIDDAWSIIQKNTIQPVTINGTDVYIVPRPNSGYVGGYRGQLQNLDTVTIIIKTGTNKIITGFPGNGLPMPYR